MQLFFLSLICNHTSMLSFWCRLKNFCKMQIFFFFLKCADGKYTFEFLFLFEVLVDHLDHWLVDHCFEIFLKKTCLSYKIKPNKNFILVFTFYKKSNVNQEITTPEIIEIYNSTNGSRDTLHQMCNKMSCSKNIRRCVFFYYMTYSVCFIAWQISV